MRYGYPRRRYRRPDGTFRVSHLEEVYAGMAADRLRPVIDQRVAMGLLGAACTARRADGRRTHDAVVFALACTMDHVTGAITATHDQLGQRAAQRIGRARPFSHDTVGRVVAVLLDAGVLVLPEGMEGKSAAALRTRVNQAPTYFVVDELTAPAGGELDPDLDVDPDDEEAVAAAAAIIAARLEAKLAAREQAETRADQGVDEVAYPSSSRREPGLTVVDHYSFTEGQDHKKTRPDPAVVPATKIERRQAADWLRAELKIGVVPSWRLDAMLARYWRAGRSAREVKRMVCQRPDGTGHGPLPLGVSRDEAVRCSPKTGATVVDVLLGCIGYRLLLWRDVPAPTTARVVRPADSSPAETPAPVPQGEARAATVKRAQALFEQTRAQARAAKEAAHM